MTDVRWAMHGPTPYLGKVMHTIFDMDKMVGGDFEAGLAALKAAAEKRLSPCTETGEDRRRGERPMLRLLQIVALMLVAVAMALSLAHALELPGKMRLGKDAYLSVQTIYYPGFTIGGIAEPLGILVLIALLVWTVRERPLLVDGGRAGARCLSSHLLVRHAPGEQLLDQGHRADGPRRDVFSRSSPRRRVAATGPSCATSGSIPTLRVPICSMLSFVCLRNRSNGTGAAIVSAVRTTRITARLS